MIGALSDFLVQRRRAVLVTTMVMAGVAMLISAAGPHVRE
jgi:hypothetical protein